MIASRESAHIAAVVRNDTVDSWCERAVATNLQAIAPYQYVRGLLEWFDYVGVLAARASGRYRPGSPDGKDGYNGL